VGTDDTIEGLLFDMGGVVFEIDFEKALRIWSQWSILTIEEMGNRFRMDGPYEKHERGEIDASQYFDHLRKLLELNASNREIASGWNAIYLEEIAETVDCILNVNDSLPCYAFTNSNPTHQEYWEAEYPRAVQCFDRVFVSSNLGLRKPDKKAFETISNETGISLSKILFFDDLEENVEGARVAGMQAVLVKSHLDVKHALENIGAL